MASINLTPALPRAQQLDTTQIIREVNAVALECRDIRLPFILIARECWKEHVQ